MELLFTLFAAILFTAFAAIIHLHWYFTVIQALNLYQRVQPAVAYLHQRPRDPQEGVPK